MANLNKVLLIGRLTRDPELKYIPSGAAVAEFGLAVNRTYTQDGEKREDTCFLEINSWGRTAELVQNYLRKGRQVFVEGYLVFDEWQTQDGQKRSKIRVTAQNIQFLDSNRSEGGAGGYGGGQQQGRSGPPPRQQGSYDNRGGAGSSAPEGPGPQAGAGGTPEEECPF